MIRLSVVFKSSRFVAQDLSQLCCSLEILFADHAPDRFGAHPESLLFFRTQEQG